VNAAETVRTWGARSLALLAALALLTTASSAAAFTIQLQANLNSAQAGNDPFGLGNGVAQGTFDTDTGVLSLDTAVLAIGIGELLGTSPYHIHLGPPGVTGPIEVVLGTTADWFSLGMGLDGMGLDFLDDVSGQISDIDQFVHSLMSGDLYLNLHTSTFGGGQIRGQIRAVPEPTTYAMISLALGGLVAFGGKRERS
jgi:hypothetical protein